VTTPTAKSLVLDLLSTLPGRAVPVRGLVTAGALFGIAENSVRVALARLLEAGLVVRDERGRYRLGDAALTVTEQVRAWRHATPVVSAWDGRWLGVHTAGLARADRRRGRTRMRALQFFGLEELSPGLVVRPANLPGGVAGVRERLVALGLEADAPVFLADFDATTDARARRLWDTRALVDGYRRSRTELERSEARLTSLSSERAMAESFLVGGRVMRQLALDPNLPEPIVPRAERDALVAAMRRYDRAGRDCWKPFLRGLGLPHRTALVGLRLDAAEERLAATRSTDRLAATGGPR
jgi:phenylacetic acid degradation operon negative regulatory protein